MTTETSPLRTPGDYTPLTPGVPHDSDGTTNGSINPDEHLRESKWYHASFIVIGEIIGSGVMGLPSAIATLGYVFGVFASLFFAWCSYYSGILLAEVRNEYYPTARSFADLSGQMVGPRMKAATTIGIVGQWLLTTPYYLMVACNSLYIAFERADETTPVCFWQYGMVIMAVMFLPLQLRTLHELRYAALVSDLAVVVAIVMIFASLAYYGRDPSVQTQWDVPKNSFLTGYNKLSSFIWAYMGQSLFLEIMSEMKHPKEFEKSLVLSNGVMVAVYTMTAVMGYYFKGVAVDGFLPGSLERGPVKTIVGLLMAYHVIVSYLLQSQVLARHFHLQHYPHTANSKDGWLHWMYIQSAVLAVSYVIANAIPFFADFQNIVGALLAAPTMFGWPAFFYWYGMKKNGVKISPFHLTVCFVFLFILTPFCTVVGTVSGIKQLVADWSTFGKPFDCIISGYS